MTSIGFIGTGNMGSALAIAAAKSQQADILLANRTQQKAEKLAEQVGGSVLSNTKVASKARYLFLGIKPQQAASVLEEIRSSLIPGYSILVSMIAGWSIERIQSIVGAFPVIRIMPNTPAMIGEGMILYAPSESVTDADMNEFLTITAAAGRFTRLDEKQIDAASAVTGCGPAFADLFVDALADGAVACGIPRAKAIEFAAQMLVGSGKLILESGKHPDLLKDEVCSPGGSTIEGVIALENGGFRAAVIAAVRAAYEKTAKL